MITIREAVYDDIPNIMNFIDKYWKKDHIFARDRDFFEWQFYENGRVNFIIGIDDKTDTIYGINGIIFFNHSENPDASGTIWKTIKSQNPILGLDLGEYLTRHYNIRYYHGAGLSKKALKINRLCGIENTKMDHYYRINPTISDYKIASICEKNYKEVNDTGYRLKQFYDVEVMKKIITPQTLATYIMKKDYDYIEKRYFNHPYYKYEFWEIDNPSQKGKAVLITRDEEYENSYILKIIDYYGDPTYLGKITFSLDQLIQERGYEFVDVYSYGIPNKIYAEAGFEFCDENSQNIIPNYFHPFEKKNVDLDMAVPWFEGLRFFRGDGDQDRPC